MAADVNVIRIVCTGGKKFPHRRVLVYETDSAGWDLTDASLELRCGRCGLAPRFIGITLRGILRLAEDAGGELDLAHR